MGIQWIESVLRQDILWNNQAREEAPFFDTLSNALDDNRVSLSVSEVANLIRNLQRTSKIEGDIAELGVFLGGSAKLISMIRPPEKQIYLFDTFEGLPEVSDVDLGLEKGQMAVSFDEVKAYLSHIPGLTICRGFFPGSAALLPSQNLKFSFVHLDMDTYQSTLAGLEYFYPRMTKGGRILLHDYRSMSCRGVKKAVDEFFQDRTDQLVDLWQTQIMVIKN